MDLSELRADHSARHPWELARARAVLRILKDRGTHPISRVLDYGCGDGFTGLEVAREFRSAFVGVDLHLDEARCREWSREPAVRFGATLPENAGTFDLALLCDVIEHVEDDVALLRTVAQSLAATGEVLVTVPAFQSLFSAHDRALAHHRRYRRAQLLDTLRAAGLTPIASGYLFGSLLAPRIAGVLKERLLGEPPVDSHGVGGWNGSATMTTLVETLLELDNRALLLAGRAGLMLPGLSTWGLARVSRSS
jgi:SAM-dependent methyltransferase